MNGNGYSEENSGCYLHPNQIVVGVCSKCLHERLLILAAKQSHKKYHSSTSRGSHRLQSAIHRKPSASLHKIFAFGSLFSRPEPQQPKSQNYHYDESVTPEDSFISMRVEESGEASWEEKKTVSKVSLENCSKMSWNHHCLIPNKGAKSSDALRWRKRIGHMFKLIRLKKSSKVSGCHVGSKTETVKVRRGWMRKQTKRNLTIDGMRIPN